MSLKEYESIVKKIRDTPEDGRGDLSRQKADIADKLRKQAGGSHDKLRKLKFTMDEINNS